MSIQLKRGTTSKIASSTATLDPGQPLVDVEKRKLYVGDGTTEVSKLKSINAVNIEDGTGPSAVQQVQDGTSGTFDFTNKNPNATALDSTLTGQIKYGGQGAFSTAFGGKSSAQGKRSFAAGTTVVAKGAYSAAFGDNCVTLGGDSFTEGYMNVSKGQASHSEGSGTQALGEASHSEGYQTKAQTNYTHAEGRATIASGANAHSEGDTTQAKGRATHAEGYQSVAEGEASHAEGNVTHSKGNYSHAEGSGTISNGLQSHTEGLSTKTLNSFSGLSSSGTGSSGSGSSGGSTVDGSGSVTGGDNWNPVIGSAAHAEGNQTLALGHASHAEGVTTQSLGHYSHAEGWLTTAGYFNGDRIYSGSGAHAEGYRTTARGDGSHSEGRLGIAFAEASHAEGYLTHAYGIGSHAEGSNTWAQGNYSHAGGSNSSTDTSATNAFAQGEGVKAVQPNQVVIGKYNDSSKAAFIIGNGTDDNNRSNLLSVEGREVRVGLSDKSSSDYMSFDFVMESDTGGSFTYSTITAGYYNYNIQLPNFKVRMAIAGKLPNIYYSDLITPEAISDWKVEAEMNVYHKLPVTGTAIITINDHPYSDISIKYLIDYRIVVTFIYNKIDPIYNLYIDKISNPIHIDRFTEYLTNLKAKITIDEQTIAPTYNITGWDYTQKLFDDSESTQLLNSGTVGNTSSFYEGDKRYTWMPIKINTTAIY